MARLLKTIGILYRSDRPEATLHAKKVAAWLEARDKKVHSMPSPLLKNSQLKFLDQLDLMVVLGGDGTYLEAVRLLAGRPTPVLGANFGHTGFLTETIAEEIFPVLDKHLKGKGTSFERSMLDVTVLNKKKKVLKTFALNDVVVERGGNTHLLEMSVFHGESLVTRFRADGLIVATPTGSTAYNLSASGPIIHPHVPAIVVTPVCPHSLTARSITLPDSECIRITINQPGRRAFLMVDGQPGGEIDSDHEILINKSKSRHLMLSSEGFDYFERLNEKLQFGQRL
jgi:NAD+ kinase